MFISKLLANLHKKLRIIYLYNENKLCALTLCRNFISSLEIIYFYNRVYSGIVFIGRHFNIYLQNKVHNIKSDNLLSDAQTYTNCRLVFFNLLFVCL